MRLTATRRLAALVGWLALGAHPVWAAGSAIRIHPTQHLVLQGTDEGFMFSEAGKATLRDIAQLLRQREALRTAVALLPLTTLLSGGPLDVGTAVATFPWDAWARVASGTSGLDRETMRIIGCDAWSASRQALERARREEDALRRLYLQREARFFQRLAQTCR